jgi:hypothetical protein
VCTFFYPKQSTLAGSSLLPLISSIPIYEQSGLAWHYDMDRLSTIKSSYKVHVDIMSFVPKVVKTEAVLACSSVGALEDVQFKCHFLVCSSSPVDLFHQVLSSQSKRPLLAVALPRRYKENHDESSLAVKDLVKSIFHSKAEDDH